jgi:hypothetical protein
MFNSMTSDSAVFREMKRRSQERFPLKLRGLDFTPCGVGMLRYVHRNMESELSISGQKQFAENMSRLVKYNIAVGVTTLIPATYGIYKGVTAIFN